MMPILTTTECTLPWSMTPPSHGHRELDAGAVTMVLLLSALWGGNTVAVKIGVLDSPPLMLAALRFVIGGTCVVAWGLWTRAAFRLEPGEWRPLLGLGLLFATQLGLLNVGVWLSTAGHAAVLLNAYPVHIVLLAHFLVPGDRLTAPKLGGVLLGYGGVLTLFSGQLWAAAEPGSTTLLGDVVLSVSALLLALRQVVLNRQLQRIHPLKPLLAQVVVGTPLFLLLSWGLESQPTVATWRLAGSLFYQGVVIAGFNFIANMYLLKAYRPSALAAFALTTPLFGVLATALVIGEPIGWRLAAAALLVAGGVAAATVRVPFAVVSSGDRRRPARHSAP
jgi:drug/metabolite transporter (DMT)-like permease